MSNRQLSLVERPRSVPVQFEGLSLAECAVEWFRAGWDVHPTCADGVKIQKAPAKPLRNEADVLRAFDETLGATPGMRLAVNLPEDVVVIEVRPRQIKDETSRLSGKMRTESWKETLSFLGSKYDPYATLSKCPCQRISGYTGVRLWLKMPERAQPIEDIVVHGPDNTFIYCGEALVHVPPGGSQSLGTRTSWLAAPLSGEWTIPPCPDALWNAILLSDRDDLGM